MFKPVFLFITLFPIFGWAHGGVDPVHELKKNENRIKSAQLAFVELQESTAKIDNLETQVNYLQKNVILLRNLMASDYPHVNKGMSKYKLDYMGELDANLTKFRETLKQVRSANLR